MMLPTNVQIYFSLKPTDMRKAINGLMLVVADQLKLDPASGHLFLFSNKRGDKLKALYYERDCFTLWYRRLEKGRFKLPKLRDGHIEITQEQFTWLLNSFDFAKMSPFQTQSYKSFY